MENKPEAEEKKMGFQKGAPQTSQVPNVPIRSTQEIENVPPLAKADAHSSSGDAIVVGNMVQLYHWKVSLSFSVVKTLFPEDTGTKATI